MRTRRVHCVVGAAVLCGWCGWVSGFHRSSTPAEITWVVSVALVVAVAMLFRLGRSGAAFGWNIGTATYPWPRPVVAGAAERCAGSRPGWASSSSAGPGTCWASTPARTSTT